MLKRRWLWVGALWASSLGMSMSALGQAYPSKPLKIVVPFPAGGSADTLTRLVGQHMSKRFGQPVVVENKPGGGTVIAGAMVAKAPADGYTLLLIANSLVINAKLRNNLPYDGLKAFDPIALLIHSPQVIAVSSNTPYKSLKEWVDAAKAQQGSFSYATVGPVTTQHIAGEMFKRVAGIDMTYTPFTGGLLAANAVMGGHVSMVLTNLNEMAAMLESGKLRPLAVTMRDRLDVLPQVPTVIEQGYKDYEAVAWFALAAPAGTPADIIQKIADDLQASLSDPEVKQKLIGAGLYPNFLGPKALAAHIQQEYERYSRVIDEARIKLD